MSLRVCQVVATLDIGGIERWLLNVQRYVALRHRDDVHIDYVTLFGGNGALAPEFAAAGSEVRDAQFSWRDFSSSRDRLRELLAKGRYDVVHCHADYLGGVVLPVARAVDVPFRINHIHNTRFGFDERANRLRWMAGRLLRRRSLSSAQLHVGCSADALAAFVGADGSAVPTSVVYCGTPLQAYENWVGVAQAEARAALDLPVDVPVILHVGRHVAPKNVGFLLDAFARLRALGVEAQLLLAGSGPLTAELAASIERQGLGSQVRLLGDRDDVPRLLRAANLLALPSIHEGLPVAVVEAQAAGVRCLIADDVTREVEIVPGLVSRASLALGADGWAGSLREELNRPSPDPVQCLAAVRRSPFDLESGSERLLEMYRQGLRSAH